MHKKRVMKKGFLPISLQMDDDDINVVFHTLFHYTILLESFRDHIIVKIRFGEKKEKKRRWKQRMMTTGTRKINTKETIAQNIEKFAHVFISF
jgi:hypothetical protein